jgi:hypothetical protein
MPQTDHCKRDSATLFARSWYRGLSAIDRASHRGNSSTCPVERTAADECVKPSSTGDRYAWPSVVEAVGRTSHGVRFTELLREVSRTHSGHPQSRGRSLAGRGLSWRHGDPATH